MTLAVDLGGLKLRSPVLGASGCVGAGEELRDLVDLRRVGAIVTKSVTLRPTRGMGVPRMVETASGMLNAIGLQNPGADAFVETEAPWFERAGVPMIVSIAGRSVEEFAEVAHRVAELPNVVALEINISCPNVERRGEVFACDPNAAAAVVTAVTTGVELPAFAKLTADVTDIVAVARACVDAGARGLSLINTLLGMAIDVDTFRARLGGVTGGLSGPAIKPVAVRAVFQVSRALPDVPIIGIGGIRNARDAIEFLLAGARAVAVGTAVFADPQVLVDVAEGIGTFLDEHGLESPADLRGRVAADGEVEALSARGG